MKLATLRVAQALTGALRAVCLWQIFYRAYNNGARRLRRIKIRP